MFDLDDLTMGLDDFVGNSGITFPQNVYVAHIDEELLQEAMIDIKRNVVREMKFWENQITQKTDKASLVRSPVHTSGKKMFYVADEKSLDIHLDNCTVDFFEIVYKPYWVSRDNRQITVVDAINGKMYTNTHNNKLENPIAAIVADAENNGLRSNTIADLMGREICVSEPKMEKDKAEKIMGKNRWGLEFWYVPHWMIELNINGHYSIRESHFHTPHRKGLFYSKHALEDVVLNQSHFKAKIETAYDVFYGKKVDLLPSVDKVAFVTTTYSDYVVLYSNKSTKISNEPGLGKAWRPIFGGRVPDEKSFWR